MIRVVRTYTAKPGKLGMLAASLTEARNFIASQDIDVRIFVEPWGDGGRVYLHADHEDAGAAQDWLRRMMANQRGKEERARMADLTEGNHQAIMLVDVADFGE